MTPFLRELAWLFNRKHREADLRAELEFHMGKGDITSKHDATPAEWIEWRRSHAEHNVALGIRAARAAGVDRGSNAIVINGC